MNEKPSDSVLEDLDAGAFMQKIQRAIGQVALGTVETRKVGTVVITLTTKQIGDSNQVNMTHSIKHTIPTLKGKVLEENASQTALYVAGTGKLTLFPDTQTRMFDKQDR